MAAVQVAFQIPLFQSGIMTTASENPSLKKYVLNVIEGRGKGRFIQ
jgi:hypothetical protein